MRQLFQFSGHDAGHNLIHELDPLFLYLIIHCCFTLRALISTLLLISRLLKLYLHQKEGTRSSVIHHSLAPHSLVEKKVVLNPFWLTLCRKRNSLARRRWSTELWQLDGTLIYKRLLTLYPPSATLAVVDARYVVSLVSWLDNVGCNAPRSTRSGADLCLFGRPIIWYSW